MDPEKETSQGADSSAETKKADTTSETETKTEKPEESKEQTVPYTRFKEVNEQLKSIQEQIEKDKQEAEQARLAKLPEEEKLKEQAQRASQVEAENKGLKAQNKKLEDALSGYLEAELKGLSAKDKSAIQAMASDAVGQLAALAKAKEAGWIGAPQKPPVPTTHTGKAGAGTNNAIDLKTPDGAFAYLKKQFSGS